MYGEFVNPPHIPGNQENAHQAKYIIMLEIEKTKSSSIVNYSIKVVLRINDGFILPQLAESGLTSVVKLLQSKPESKILQSYSKVESNSWILLFHQQYYSFPSRYGLLK